MEGLVFKLLLASSGFKGLVFRLGQNVVCVYVWKFRLCLLLQVFCTLLYGSAEVQFTFFISFVAVLRILVVYGV